MLLKENWAGRHHTANLRDRACAIQQHFRQSHPHMSGPHLLVSDRVTVALSLAFYELATNAVKIWRSLERERRDQYHMGHYGG